MPLSGAGGQNIGHPHTLVSANWHFIFFFFFFFVKCILILLARHDSGELRCHATDLILNFDGE